MAVLFALSKERGCTIPPRCSSKALFTRAILDDLEGTRTQDGKARNNFLQLFETDHIVHHKSVSPVFAMPELDDDKLIELEDSQDEL